MICRLSSIGWCMGRPTRSASVSMALNVAASWSPRVPIPGRQRSLIFEPSHCAKDSLSQMSSHQTGVTRSPNHWCAISCATIPPKMLCCSGEGRAPISRWRSSKTIAPAFSMAMPWIGDAIRSSFGYGKAEPKYSSSQSTISPVCRAAKASFLPCPLLATNRSGSGRRLRPLGGTARAWMMSKGPTANASRYVGNGCVTTKWWRTRLRSEVFEASRVFDTTLSRRSATTVTSNGVLKRGSSNPGKRRARIDRSQLRERVPLSRHIGPVQALRRLLERRGVGETEHGPAGRDLLVEIHARDTADGFDFRIPALDRASRRDQDDVGNAETVAVQPDGARGFAQREIDFRRPGKLGLAGIDRQRQAVGARLDRVGEPSHGNCIVGGDRGKRDQNGNDEQSHEAHTNLPRYL